MSFSITINSWNVRLLELPSSYTLIAADPLVTAIISPFSRIRNTSWSLLPQTKFLSFCKPRISIENISPALKVCLCSSVLRTTHSSSLTTLITIEDASLESFLETALRVTVPSFNAVIEKSSLIDAIVSSLTVKIKSFILSSTS